MSLVQDRLQSNIDKYLAYIIQTQDKLLLSKLPVEVFSDEQNILVKVMNKFRGTETKIDREFLSIFLARNKKIITENPQVDHSILDEFSTYPVEEYINLTINKLNELENKDISDINPENLSIQIIEDYKHLEMLDILDKTREVTIEGLKVGRKQYDGIEDALSYSKERLSKIELIGSETTIRTVVSAREDYEDNSLKPDIVNELVTDFGAVDTLNKAYNGGIRTGYFYNVLAPPKTGKTRFVIMLIHIALTKYGTDVYACILEGGGSDKLLSELRATHFEYYYSKLGYTNLEPLSGQEIKDKIYPSSNIEIMEQESFRDLLYNDDYGQLYYPDSEFKLTVDNLESTIESTVKKHNIRMVVIDYLQLIDYNPKVMKKNEAISYSYITSLRLASRLNIAYISPSQMKADFLEQASRSDNLDALDTRLAAGESSEITKSPDANIALYASQQDMQEGIVYLLPYLSRIAKPYEKTKLYLENETNYFSDIDES